MKLLKNNYVVGFIAVILTIFTALSYKYDGNNIAFDNYMFANQFNWLIILFFIVLLINNFKKIDNKKIYIISFITGFILSILNTIGLTFTNYILNDIVISKKLLLYLFVKFINFGFIISMILSICYSYISKYKYNKGKLDKYFKYSRKNLIILSLIILCGYIPYFLHYYPGICSSDSTYQMVQMLTNEAVTNHHPVFHTLVIGFCLKVGNLLFNSDNVGIAIYSILQMIACAFTFAFAILYLGKKKVPASIQKLLLLFFLFCPIICFYSITMWKDIPFALCVTITTILLIESYTNKQFLKNNKNVLILGIFILLSIMFRQNGLYSLILAFFVIILTVSKDLRKRMACAFIIPIAISFIIIGPIYDMCGIIPGNSREMMSVPMQLFARVRKYHSKELNNNEKKELDNFFTDKNYKDYYDPVFADPVKRVFSEEYLQEDKLRIVQTYFKYSFKYPTEAIKSFIAGSYGYYYPNLVGWEVFTTIYDDWEPFLQNPSENNNKLEIGQTPIIKNPYVSFMEKFVNSHNVPILSMLTSCGFYFWLLIVTVMYYIYKKRYRLLATMSPILFIWLTTLASPVFCERRYVYSLFIVVPLFFALCFAKIESKN